MLQIFAMIFIICANFMESLLLLRFGGFQYVRLNCQDFLQSTLDLLSSGFYIVISVILLVITYGDLEPNKQQCRIMYNWCKGAPYYLIITNFT